MTTTADLVGARRVEQLADYVRKTVAAAPELTSAAQDRLALLLSTASAHPETIPAAAMAASTATTRPSCKQRDEAHHVSGQ